MGGPFRTSTVAVYSRPEARTMIFPHFGPGSGRKDSKFRASGISAAELPQYPCPQPVPAGEALMRGTHDLGGLPAGPLDLSDHDKAPWEKRFHALLLLLADPARNLVNVDELRRGIDALGSDEYDRLAYYERWITSI